MQLYRLRPPFTQIRLREEDERPEIAVYINNFFSGTLLIPPYVDSGELILQCFANTAYSVGELHGPGEVEWQTRPDVSDFDQVVDQEGNLYYTSQLREI